MYLLVLLVLVVSVDLWKFGTSRIYQAKSDIRRVDKVCKPMWTTPIKV